MKSILAAVIIVALVAACDPGASTMRVSWQRDSVSAEFTLPAIAVWCTDQGWLEVVGARSDTGVALALFPGDTVITGKYPIVQALERSDSIRPVAAVAVRWFSEDELLSFEGIEGEVVVEYTTGGLAGRFDAGLRVPVGSDSLRLEGAFSETPVTRGGIECRSTQPDSTDGDDTEVLD